MATYFEAINDNGRVIIDDKNSRLTLKRHGNLTNLAEQEYAIRFSLGTGAKAPPNIAYFGVIFTMRLASDEEFVSFYLIDGFSDKSIVYVRQFGKLVKFYFACYSTDSTEMNKAVNYVYVYVYGQRNKKNEKYGLEIFDKNGVQIFHSSDKLLNIKGIGTYGMDISDAKQFNPSLEPLPNVTSSQNLTIYSAPQSFFLAIDGNLNKIYNVMFTTVRGITKSNGEYAVQNISIPYAENTYQRFNLIGIFPNAITYTISDSTYYHLD